MIDPGRETSQLCAHTSGSIVSTKKLDSRTSCTSSLEAPPLQERIVVYMGVEKSEKTELSLDYIRDL
jgi:hypothetical protein